MVVAPVKTRPEDTFLDRGNIGYQMILSNSAIERIFAASGLELCAKPVEAVHTTLQKITTLAMHETHRELKPTPDQVAALLESWSLVKAMMSSLRYHGYPPPILPRAWAAAFDKWLEHEGNRQRPGRGPPTKDLRDRYIRQLLAFFWLAYGAKIDSSDPAKLAAGMKKAVPFISRWFTELNSVIDRPGSFPVCATDDPYSLIIERFKTTWTAPAEFAPLVRRNSIGIEPGKDAPVSTRLYIWGSMAAVGDWDNVKLTFQYEGGKLASIPPAPSGLKLSRKKRRIK